MKLTEAEWEANVNAIIREIRLVTGEREIAEAVMRLCGMTR